MDDLARVPLAFPTYTGNLAYAAAGAARELDLHVGWQATNIEGALATLSSSSFMPVTVNGTCSSRRDLSQ